MTIVYNPAAVATGLVLSVDPANPKSYSVNTHPNPLDIYAWSSTGANQSTLTRDATVTDSPVGGVPLKMAVTGADAYTATYNALSWTLASASTGQTWTFSFWAKASAAVTISPYIFGANSSGNNVENFSTSFTLTTSWARYSFSATLANALTTGVQVRFAGGSTSGINVWFDGAQVEQSSTVTAFNPIKNPASVWLDLTKNCNGSAVSYAPPILIDQTMCFDFSKNLGLNSTTAVCGFLWPNQPIPTTGSFTINCWVKNVPATVGQQALFTSSADANGFRFGVGADGVYWLVGPTYLEGQASYVSTFTNTQWNNVCLVYDRSGIVSGTASIYMYLNGVLQTTTSLASYIQYAWPAVGYTTAYMAKGLATFPSFSGKLGKFEVYSKALTLNDIVQNFNALRGRFGI